MQLQQKLTLILITLFLTLFISACSNDNNDNKNNSIIETKQLNITSGEEISIKATQAKAYSWKQISGIEVILINANTDTLSFIAPIVQTNETLVFELEILLDSTIGEDITKKEIVTITISPLETTTDTDTITTDTNTTVVIDTNTTTDTNTTVVTDTTTDTNTGITDTNTTTPTPTTQTLKSIKLTIEKTSLNLDENTTLNVVATYSDNTTKDVTNKVEWIISNSNTVQITKHNLKTIQDKNIILKAKLHNITSNAVALEIYNEINGHRLPPMPNKTLNDSTLLGIDVNDNGVRDDVERYLLDKYKDHHKIVSEIALQSGRAFQIVLENPENARETTKLMSAAQACNNYFNHSASSYGDPILIDNNIMEYKYEELQLNTKERIKAYLEYNHNLSGGVYRLVGGFERKAKCDFNVTDLLKAQ